MKKVIALILLTAMLFCLCACRTEAEESGAPEASPAQTPETSPAETPEASPADTPASGSDISAEEPKIPGSATDLPNVEFPASDTDIAQ